MSRQVIHVSRWTWSARLFAVVLALVVASNCHAESFSIEQVMSAPFPSQLTTAAHANRIAWVFDDKGARNVWTARGPDYLPHQVTHYEGDNGQPIASLRLTADGKSVVYATGSESNGAGRAANVLSGTRQPMQQVWVADVAGGKPRMLGELGCAEEECEDLQLSPDGKYAVWAARHALWIAPLTPAGKAEAFTDLRGDATSPRWSPDGKRLAFTLTRDDHAFVVIAQIDRGKMTEMRYVAPSVDRDGMPRWSPDGQHLAFVRTPGARKHRELIPVNPQPWSIWLADPSNFSAREIWHSGERAQDSLPPFIDQSFQYATGNRLVFDSERDGRNHLYVVDAAKGGEPALLTPGGFDVEDVSMSADGGSVLYSSNQNDVDRRHAWRVAVDALSAPAALTSGAGIEWTPQETGEGGDVVCLGSSATTPGMVYKLVGGSRELLTKDALPADFPAASLLTPKQVIFQSADGYAIHGQLFSPQGGAKPGAALIFVHGGPSRQMLLGFHYMQYYANAYAANQYLASLGFTVLSVNYRLGIMYGRDFREAPGGGWRGSAEYNDVLAGAAYLRGLTQVDPARIGIWGGSYGGLLTALALARNSNLFAAGVDFHGVHDWSVLLNDEVPGASGAPDYQSARDLAWKSSPDASIQTWKSPVLLIQGDDDRNVPFSQMVDLVQRLREQKVPFEQVVFPDELHAFVLHRHFIEGYKATAQFLQKQLAESP